MATTLNHDYEIPEDATIMGEGTYGIVCAVQKKANGTKKDKRPRSLIVKISKNADVGEKKCQAEGHSTTMLRELTFLHHLPPHDNIVQLEEAFRDTKSSSLCLVMHHGGHSLLKVLSDSSSMKNRLPTPTKFVESITKQLLEAVQHCHRHHVMHRDLKTENILISWPRSDTTHCRIRLCDFGSARFCGVMGEGHPRTPRNVTTLWYRAPEILLGSRQYDCEVDLWSLGCVLLELCNYAWHHHRQSIAQTPAASSTSCSCRFPQCIVGPLWCGQDDQHQLELIFKSLGTPRLSEWPSFPLMPDADQWLNCDGRGSVEFPKHVFSFVQGSAKRSRFKTVLQTLLSLEPRKRQTAQELLEYMSSKLYCEGVFSFLFSLHCAFLTIAFHHLKKEKFICVFEPSHELSQFVMMGAQCCGGKQENCFEHTH